jgi:hypothetical protein
VDILPQKAQNLAEGHKGLIDNALNIIFLPGQAEESRIGQRVSFSSGLSG